jgi:nucleoside-diphosphate-sugar epimerase
VHALLAAPLATNVVLGTGANMQDYVYVDNVAHAHVLAVANMLGSQTAAGQAVYISNHEPVAFRDLCVAVWKEFGHVPAWQVRVSERLAWWMGVLAEVGSWVVGVEPGLTRGMVRDGCRVRYVCNDKARRVLGYVPKVGLEEGVRRSCEVSLCGVLVFLGLLMWSRRIEKGLRGGRGSECGMIYFRVSILSLFPLTKSSPLRRLIAQPETQHPPS